MKILVAAMLAASALGAAAQTVRMPAGLDDQLRAVYATPVEIAEGARVAKTACARCHGTTGISATKGIPHLAGQRAAYLDLQLRAYRHSSRVQGAMTGVVRYLSEDALVKVAAYYASLDPPRPAAAPAKGAPKAVDPVQAGKAAAASCGGCHGELGVSATPGMPSLVALDPKYFASAVAAYKSGQRRNDMMKSMVEALSPASTRDVALYYALQKPAKAQTPAAGNAAAGKETAAASCSACHGDKGVSGNPATPSLAGQDAEYLAAALRAYKDGSRQDDSMKSPAAALDEKAMLDLAAYYAVQEPQSLNVRRPLTIAEWTERCDRCHGPNGNSLDPLVPRLAAQRADWLEHVLDAYRSGARKSTAMAAMSSLMSEADVDKLAAYYSRQSARAIVYLVVPPANGKSDK
jgi:cytochrome c553